MSYQRRHEAIKQILDRGPVESQEALQAGLAEFGIKASQATLSRDLRELGIVKGAMGYILDSSQLAGVQESRLEDALQREVFQISEAQAMVVLRTRPGAAQAVGAAFDLDLPLGVVASLAGDDTIFLAVEPSVTVTDVANQMRLLAGLIESGAEA
ncbi:MAG: arginine repressor [Phycisphaerales bacterium]